MSIKNQKQYVLVLLTIFFLALSSFAQVANQEEKPVLVKEPLGKKGGLISFYIKGGVGFVDSGDFNSLVDGYTAYSSVADYYINWPTLGSMMDFGAEIILNFTPNIGFGIGVGYITKNNIGEYGSQDPSYQVAYDREYGFRVIPISGNLHFRFLTTRLFGFSINAGVDYLMGNITHTYDYQSSAYNTSRTEEVKCNTIGYHGGISIDINFSSSVSLVVEGSYRIADFKDWKGSVESQDAGNFDGKLYYYEYESGYHGEYFPRMWVWNSAPDFYRNVRLARINLSGFSSTIGIKINF